MIFSQAHLSLTEDIIETNQILMNRNRTAVFEILQKEKKFLPPSTVVSPSRVGRYRSPMVRRHALIPTFHSQRDPTPNQDRFNPSPLSSKQGDITLPPKTSKNQFPTLPLPKRENYYINFTYFTC